MEPAVLAVLSSVVTYALRVRQPPAKPTPAKEAPVDADIVAYTTEFALATGMLMEPADVVPRGAKVHCPVSLRPTPFPRESFEHAMKLAQPFNQLFDGIGRDTKWLAETLAHTGKADPFTGRLMRIMETVVAEGIRQPFMLGIHRSDYMLHTVNGVAKDILQVEFNTIASSFGALSMKTTQLHKHTAVRFPDDGIPPEDIPDCGTVPTMALAMKAAHVAYNASNAIVVFVVQPGERNATDQRILEFALAEAHGVDVVRLTLAEIAARGRLDDKHALWVPVRGGEREVSLVYFRAGYTPDDYPSEAEWEARLLVERSLAIKCPSIGYHLAGTKKVQQALLTTGTLARFVPADTAALLQTCFAGLWSLDPKDEGDPAVVIAGAKADPDRYVLKPQREGGGNNIYGDDIPTALASMSPETLSAYILMQRIFPPTNPNVLLRNGIPMRAHTVSELGVYSVFLGDGKSTPRLSAPAGHLLRSKAVGVDEGGVATGYSVLDSVVLK